VDAHPAEKINMMKSKTDACFILISRFNAVEIPF
jgi:hypothetical protein